MCTFLFGVHMDNARSQHTLWMKMADVCRAHYFTYHRFNDHYAVNGTQGAIFLFVKRVLSLCLTGRSFLFFHCWNHAETETVK